MGEKTLQKFPELGQIARKARGARQSCEKLFRAELVGFETVQQRRLIDHKPNIARGQAAASLKFFGGNSVIEVKKDFAEIKNHHLRTHKSLFERPASLNGPAQG
jgi:hypothetical protein